MTSRRLLLLLSVAVATSCHSGRYADGPSPVTDPEGVYRIVAVKPLPALGSAISPYTALDLARYSGDGWWEYRRVSHLSPEQLLVPGDTPHTSGRSLDELSREELRTLRVRLHERAGRIASLDYLVRPGVDSTGEAELPEWLWIPRGTGRVRGRIRSTKVSPNLTIQESGAYFDEDERAEMEQLMGEMIQKYREQASSQQSRQPTDGSDAASGSEDREE